VINASIDTTQPIDNLIVTDWLDDGGEKDAVSAPVVYRLQSVGDSAAAGDWQADVYAQNDGDPWHSYIDSIEVNGTVSDATIRCDGDICDITVGAAVSSNFLSGVQDGVTLPASLDDFFTVHDWHHGDEAFSGIDTFTVTGLTDLTDGTFFQDTNIAGGSIGTVELRNVAFDNGGTSFGVYAAKWNTWGEPIHKVSIEDTASGDTNVLWNDNFPYTDQDLVIRIV
jgi:hypothetical protein